MGDKKGRYNARSRMGYQIVPQPHRLARSGGNAAMPLGISREPALPSAGER